MVTSVPEGRAGLLRGVHPRLRPAGFCPALCALPGALFSDLSEDGLPRHVLTESFIEAEALIKYSGYIKRQNDQIAKLKRQERLSIPFDFNYLDITSLSNEAREKLSFVRPQTLGQAMRGSGVSPADVSVLSVFLSTT